MLPAFKNLTHFKSDLLHTETPVKRKRGRPKGSTKKTNKPDSPSHTEDNTEREGESKDKEEVQGTLLL